nr:PTS glucose transporter subunit IIA [Oceanobacillus sp. CFH 90083]
MIHVGLDTVQLEGKHFEALVKQGDIVKQGNPLIRFDIDKTKNRL